MDRKDPTLSGVKVLVVDDEPGALEITRLMLALFHAQVVAVGSAAKGLEQLQVGRHDVIVSDIGMPVLDGYQFIRAVRKLPEHIGGKTPAVALTAFSSAEVHAKAINAGFQRHLHKPVELHALIQAVADLVGLTGAASSRSC